MTDEHFAWMLGQSRDQPDLRLPDEGIDREIVSHVRKLVRRLREAGMPDYWMIVADGEVVGLCGFKNACAAGAVEIGYNVWPSRQRMGHATRAVAAMLEAAAENRSIVRVTAETTAENVPSHRVLVANGFRRIGTRYDPDDGNVVLWSRPLSYQDP